MCRLILLFLILFLSSCHYFEKQKLNADDLLEEQIEAFDWNAVDIYPKFSNCDSIIDKTQSKICFQNTLLSHVNTYLEHQRIVVSKDVNDTIQMFLSIDKNGLLKVEDLNIQPNTKSQIPEIDSLLRQSIIGIPRIFPAIKRGQEVTTAFELPVIVKID